MLTELQKRKVTHQFHAYDSDRTGYIERGDYERSIEHVAKSFGYVPGTPEHDELRRYFLELWENIAKLADGDEDGRVSLDEYIASHDSLLADRETFLAGMAVVVDRFFVIGDRDRDGHIVESEYAMHVAPFGVSAEEARGSFERLDRDGDGKISRDEMLKNLEEFYFSDDPDARGNWVLGPLRT